MQHAARMTTVKQKEALKLISFRNRPHLDAMIEAVKEKSGFSQSDVIRSCLAIQLPKLMEQYNAGNTDDAGERK